MYPAELWPDASRKLFLSIKSSIPRLFAPLGSNDAYAGPFNAPLLNVNVAPLHCAARTFTENGRMLLLFDKNTPQGQSSAPSTLKFHFFIRLFRFLFLKSGFATIESENRSRSATKGILFRELGNFGHRISQ